MVRWQEDGYGGRRFVGRQTHVGGQTDGIAHAQAHGLLDGRLNS